MLVRWVLTSYNYTKWSYSELVIIASSCLNKTTIGRTTLFVSAFQDPFKIF